MRDNPVQKRPGTNRDPGFYRPGINRDPGIKRPGPKPDIKRSPGMKIVHQDAVMWVPRKNGKGGFLALRSDPTKPFSGKVVGIRKGTTQREGPANSAIYSKGRNTIKQAKERREPRKTTGGRYEENKAAISRGVVRPSRPFVGGIGGGDFGKYKGGGGGGGGGGKSYPTAPKPNREGGRPKKPIYYANGTASVYDPKLGRRVTVGPSDPRYPKRGR